MLRAHSTALSALSTMLGGRMHLCTTFILLLVLHDNGDTALCLSASL